MVDGHDGDAVLGVRLQAPQDGGGGGSGHLVLQRRKESSLNWVNSRIHQIPRKEIMKKVEVLAEGERLNGVTVGARCEPKFLGLLPP